MTAGRQRGVPARPRKSRAPKSGRRPRKESATPRGGVTLAFAGGLHEKQGGSAGGEALDEAFLQKVAHWKISSSAEGSSRKAPVPRRTTPRRPKTTQGLTKSSEISLEDSNAFQEMDLIKFCAMRPRLEDSYFACGEAVHRRGRSRSAPVGTEPVVQESAGAGSKAPSSSASDAVEQTPTPAARAKKPLRSSRKGFRRETADSFSRAVDKAKAMLGASEERVESRDASAVELEEITKTYGLHASKLQKPASADALPGKNASASSTPLGHPRERKPTTAGSVSTRKRSRRSMTSAIQSFQHRMEEYWNRQGGDRPTSQKTDERSRALSDLDSEIRVLNSKAWVGSARLISPPTSPVLTRRWRRQMPDTTPERKDVADDDRSGEARFGSKATGESGAKGEEVLRMEEVVSGDFVVLNSTITEMRSALRGIHRRDSLLTRATMLDLGKWREHQRRLEDKMTREKDAVQTSFIEKARGHLRELAAVYESSRGERDEKTAQLTTMLEELEDLRLDEEAMIQARDSDDLSNRRSELNGKIENLQGSLEQVQEEAESFCLQKEELHMENERMRERNKRLAHELSSFIVTKLADAESLKDQLEEAARKCMAETLDYATDVASMRLENGALLQSRREILQTMRAMQDQHRDRYHKEFELPPPKETQVVRDPESVLFVDGRKVARALHKKFLVKKLLAQKVISNGSVRLRRCKTLLATLPPKAYEEFAKTKARRYSNLRPVGGPRSFEQKATENLQVFADLYQKLCRSLRRMHLNLKASVDLREFVAEISLRVQSAVFHLQGNKPGSFSLPGKNDADKVEEEDYASPRTIARLKRRRMIEAMFPGDFRPCLQLALLEHQVASMMDQGAHLADGTLDRAGGSSHLADGRLDLADDSSEAEVISQ